MTGWILLIGLASFLVGFYFGIKLGAMATKKEVERLLDAAGLGDLK
jgi:hypothetical protein